MRQYYRIFLFVVLFSSLTSPSWSEDLDPFTQLAYDAAQASFDATVGAISESINLYYAQKLIELGVDVPPAEKYPATLDDQPDGPCVTCFSKVLEPPINNSKWTKKGLTYTYTDGSFSATAIYNPQEGTFKKNN